MGGVAVSALALALQPDRGMAAVLAAGLIAIALLRRDATALAAASTGVASLVATLAQPDRLPAVPHVDQLLYTSFDIHLVAGLAVLTGSVLLVVPGAVAWVRDPGERVVYGALGSVWFAAVVAAALGNYPTPVVGYGGSAVIGYILALAALRRSIAHNHNADVAERCFGDGEEERPMFRTSLMVWSAVRTAN
jgi:cell division protein FtsW (lipid II flippase)